jgi:putative flavoprotein involved in K+ transport
MEHQEDLNQKYRRELKPVLDLLKHKKKKMNFTEWENLVHKTAAGVIDAPEQYLSDFPKKETVSPIVNMMFNELIHSSNRFDVVVIGGGQSGLAVGYYLRRTGLSFTILDMEIGPGGAWQHMWNSLRLFSPAQWSSLPGIIMNGGADYYPTRNETIDYIAKYEEKYDLPVRRPVQVINIRKTASGFHLETSDGDYYAKVIVSATGSFRNPYIPAFPGIKQFKGKVIHASEYHAAEEFRNKTVAIVGEGNSGAQILAEVSKVASTLWITQKEPRFLPDHIDGRYLFDAASQMYQAKLQGKSYQPPSLGDIVMVPRVREARENGALQHSVRPFKNFTAHGLQWNDGHEEKIDVVIFCTGFRADLRHLNNLSIVNEDGRVPTTETKAIVLDGLWMVGYGNWTGFASATLIGVGRSAKATVEQISEFISAVQEPIPT